MLFQTTPTVACADGDIYLLNGVGVLVETSRAPDDFNNVLMPRDRHWNRECEKLKVVNVRFFFCKVTGVSGD